MMVESRIPRYDELEIRTILEVPPDHTAEVTDDLSQDFVRITLHREARLTGASGIGLPEALVLIILATVARGFLGELGKDAYRTTRGLLWRLYKRLCKRLRLFQTEIGAFKPLSVVVGKSVAALYFMFEENLTEEQFTKAISSMASAIEAETDLPGEDVSHLWGEFRFDIRSGTWKRAYKEIDGLPVADDDP